MAVLRRLGRKHKISLYSIILLFSFWISFHTDWAGISAITGTPHSHFVKFIESNRLAQFQKEMENSYIPTTTPKPSYDIPELLLGGGTSIKNACSNGVILFIYIQSSWSNFYRRRSLRQSWASDGIFRDLPTAVRFIVGKPPTAIGQVRLNNENIRFGDILEGNFTDSFASLTLKSHIAMEWMVTRCKTAKYVLKADDDMFVNIFKVAESILPELKPDQNVIACHVHNEGTSPIIRDKNSKWYIPDHIFPNRTHLPQFCSGYFVVTTSKLLSELYRISKGAELIYVDDVYLFGHILNKAQDVHFINIQDSCTLSEKQGLEAYNTGGLSYLGVYTADSNTMAALWSATLLNLSDWARKHSKIHRVGVNHKEKKPQF